jgi:hypothetical protein
VTGPAAAGGLVYLLHFNELYVPYPGAPAYACAGHYTGKPESSGFLKAGLAADGVELAELACSVSGVRAREPGAGMVNRGLPRFPGPL